MPLPVTARRVRPAELIAEPHQWRAAGIDYRFVREVERLERDGRVKSRGDLELTVGMYPGYIQQIRQGRYEVSAVHIALLQQYYQADYRFILFGERIPGEGEAATIIRPGQGRVRVVQEKPYFYRYRKPAGWRIGPQPEEDARHYPDDPSGRIWIPHYRAPAWVLAQFERYKAKYPDLPLVEAQQAIVPRGRGKKNSPDQ